MNHHSFHLGRMMDGRGPIVPCRKNSSKIATAIKIHVAVRKCAGTKTPLASSGREEEEEEGKKSNVNLEPGTEK